MRFKKGDKVEVMNREEAPVSWCIAEILSGNGHTYHVKYDSYPGKASEQMVEKFSRKFIRPCPPLVQGVGCFEAGDIVEVFYDYSWKTAGILKVLGGEKGNTSDTIKNQYLARLIGCSQQLIVEKPSIRMRLTWHDDKWILMEKSSVGGDEVLASKPSTSNCYQKMNFQISNFTERAKKQTLKDCMEIQNATFSKSPMFSSRSLKRTSPYSSSIVEAHNERNKKFRRIATDGEQHRMTAENGYYNQIEMAKENDVFGCYQVRSSKSYNSDSVVSSVGSCSSTTSQSPKNYGAFIPCKETETLCSDAESCYGSGSERKSSFLPLKEEEVEISIHRLELHAYRTTLKALYVSGPLSWEREELLTNLRDVLHISNDQHLIEGIKLEACIIASKGLKMKPGFVAFLLA